MTARVTEASIKRAGGAGGVGMVKYFPHSAFSLLQYVCARRISYCMRTGDKTMTTAEKINEAIKAGKTVTVATYLKVVNVKSKHVAAWEAAGHQFFKADAKGATMMIDGQSNGKPRYVCIDGARITAA